MAYKRSYAISSVMPEDTIDRLEDYAKAHEITRSKTILNAVEAFLKGRN